MYIYFLSLNLPPFLSEIISIVYVLLVIFTIIIILLDTDSTSKTLAYLMLVLFVPLLGIIFFFSFGGNYRHMKSTKQFFDELKKVTNAFKKKHKDKTQSLLKDYSGDLKQYKELVEFVYNQGNENLNFNDYHLLKNGEKKFPDVLKELDKAKSFIHMEYYAWDNDIRGNQIKDVLLKKAKEGVKVKVLYDAYASRGIKNNIVKELQSGGIEIYPVIKIKIEWIASRFNHRDHRKVIIIDGITGYVGGINISDRYDNSIDTKLFWRDTHVRIEGETVLNMQRHFIVNWNSVQPNKLTYTKELFPEIKDTNIDNKRELAQIVAGGPIYPISNIMLTYFKIFTLATDKLYITNPYFIPNESILDALKQAAISGVDVRLLVPKKSDSALVGAASKFYYTELLNAGVKIYLYKKGFVHAKTLIADSYLSVVGTANMDIRSFNLNFEIMSLIYGKNFAKKLEYDFMQDLEISEEVKYEDWIKNSKVDDVIYSLARLISSFL